MCSPASAWEDKSAAFYLSLLFLDDLHGCWAGCFCDLQFLQTFGGFQSPCQAKGGRSMQKRKRKEVDKEEENSETLQRMKIGRVRKKKVWTHAHKNKEITVSWQPDFSITIQICQYFSQIHYWSSKACKSRDSEVSCLEKVCIQTL